MISVEIKINNRRIHKITAVNVGKIKRKGEWRKYQLNCGCLLEHDRKKGALCMMIQMAGHAMMCPKDVHFKHRRKGR